MDRVFAKYDVETVDVEHYTWELTEDEESFLRKKMENFVKMDLKSYVSRGRREKEKKK